MWSVWQDAKGKSVEALFKEMKEIVHEVRRRYQRRR
jgi:acyl-CoA-binding protein